MLGFPVTSLNRGCRIDIVCLAGLAIWAFGAARLAAEPPISSEKSTQLVADDSRADEGPVLRDNRQEVIASAAKLVGLGWAGGRMGPAQVACILIGEDRKLWVTGEGNKAPSLQKKYLNRVRDHRGIANGFEAKDEDTLEVDAYCDALYKSYLTSADVFANSSNRSVTRAHLYGDPANYRGQVVHVEGNLHLLRRFDAPLNLAQKGLHDQYEGWIMQKSQGANPTCVVFIELPDGLEPAEELDVPVSFDGYFFKIYRYDSRDQTKGSHEREAPLLIGRSITLLMAGATAEGSLTTGPGARSSRGLSGSSLLYGLLGLTVGTLLLAVGLAWWFRSGDRQVRDRLAKAYTVNFGEPSSLNQTPAAQNPRFVSNQSQVEEQDAVDPPRWRLEPGEAEKN